MLSPRLRLKLRLHSAKVKTHTKGGARNHR
jgi:hypothetical protein